MNIVYFTGGLGNQIFQYALYRTLELNGKAKIMANISWYDEVEEPCFLLQKSFKGIELKKDDCNIFQKKRNRYLKIRRGRRWIAFINYHFLALCSYFKEKESCVYDERVFKLRNAAIWGYWQTEKYFTTIENVLLKELVFSYGEDNLEALKKKLLADDCSVAVHVRRGDYLKNVDIYGSLSESQYYRNAILYIKGEIKHVHLIFFSDDISWVKEKYNYKNAVYIDKTMFEHYESWYDMCLMSCCAHNIIANSSYSWWAAWLNKNKSKIVIAPKQWFYDRETPDIWCDGWIRM